MRTAAAMVVVVCAAVALTGCVAASADAPLVADSALDVSTTSDPAGGAPGALADAGTSAAGSGASEAAAEGEVAPGGEAAPESAAAEADEVADVAAAERTSSIHAGPVRASIVATRESDGQELSVAVDLPRAFDGDPLVTVVCSLDSSAGGLAVVIQDLAIQEGVATATLVIPEDVSGPGTYDGVLALLGAEGESVRAQGSFTVADGLDSGRFDVEDPATGEDYAGAWECRAL